MSLAPAALPDRAAPAAWLKSALAPHRRVIARAGLMTVADVVPAVGFAAGLALAIGALSDGAGLGGAAFGLALAAFSAMVRGLIAHGAAHTGAEAARVVKHDLRARLLRSAFAGPARPSGEMMTAVVEGVESLDGYVSRFAAARMAAAVSPLLVIAACAMVSPFAAGILTFTLFPFVVGMALAGTAAAHESRRQFQALERLSGLFLDRVRALPAVLSFQAEERIADDLGRSSDDLARRTGRVLKIAFLSSAVLEFFSALSVALVAVYCGFNLLKLLPFPAPEQLDLARAFFVLALAPEVYAPIRRLAAAYHERQAAEAAAPSLDASSLGAPGLGASADLPPPHEDRPAPSPPRTAPAASDLAFRSVCIAYDGGESVLRDFDLLVPAGAMVALAGPSGSGKTSLLHLLLGLAPLTGGEVEAHGLKLSRHGAFGPLIAWASQAPVALPGRLYDNIALAWPEASARQVLDAAARAGLGGDLDRMLDERGGGLSGGERRRLGLARALLKPAPILLLDEPTANLDAAAEAALLPVIREAARGRTTLIATHSAAVMAMADEVVRL